MSPQVGLILHLYSFFLFLSFSFFKIDVVNEKILPATSVNKGMF